MPILPSDDNKQPIQAMAPIDDGVSQSNHQISFDASAVNSSELDSDTEVLRLYPTQDCHIRFGEESTIAATTSHMPLPAGQVEYLKKPKGAKYIDAIKASSAGTLNITEME